MPMPGTQQAGADATRLHVTRRCCRSDLGERSYTDVTALASRHAIVDEFRRVRLSDPITGARVESLTSDLEVCTVETEEAVAATWHERPRGRVWLLAVAPAGTSAHDYFRSLDDVGELFPSEQDVVNAVLAELPPDTAPAVLLELGFLLRMAVEANGKERAYQLSDGTTAKLVVRCEARKVVEVHAAFSTWRPTPMPAGFLLPPLVPGAANEEWQRVKRMPHRALAKGEIGFRYRAKQRR